MVNINIQVPDDIHKKVKLAAVEAEVTVKEYIIRKLEASLGRRAR